MILVTNQMSICNVCRESQSLSVPGGPLDAQVVGSAHWWRSGALPFCNPELFVTSWNEVHEWRNWLKHNASRGPRTLLWCLKIGNNENHKWYLCENKKQGLKKFRLFIDTQKLKLLARVWSLSSSLINDQKFVSPDFIEGSMTKKNFPQKKSRY